MFTLAVLAALLASPIYVTSINSGDALTLPSARHVVRLEPANGRPATWLLALQQDGADGHRLSFWRSDDEAQSWRWYAPIQDTSTDRDRADLIAVGMDVAVVYSYEGPTFSGSTAHDVYFQWWRYDGSADWVARSPVKVFDSTSSSTAYGRAMIARDSAGRLWIWAQRLNGDGTFTLVMSVSTDGGSTFQQQPSLDTFANRPGGRIMPIGGNRLMLLYSTRGGAPGYMRLRNDSDALSTWGARQTVFSEGIYHGDSLSATSDGSGGVHLVYKDGTQELWYRHFDGSSWSGRQLVESSADWAEQPAITRVGSALVIFWNRVITVNSDYRFYYRILSGGALGSPQLLDGSVGFKGYPAAVDVLPDTVAKVPCFYGSTPDANTGGNLALVFSPTPGTPSGPPGGTLFFDDFDRSLSSGLGPAWSIDSGAWLDDNRANSNKTGVDDRASVIGLSCGDCTVQSRLVQFGTYAALDLRQQASGDRYDVALLSSGHLQIRRHDGTSTSVLGDVASGIADLTSWSTISLAATGAGPVQLVASVNGVAKLSVTDSSASAIVAPGTAGIDANVAGVWFDDFVVTGNGTGPGGGTDGGVSDGGASDGGTSDGGTTDGGTSDGGTSDGGTSDGGTSDGGTTDGGTSDGGTSDGGTGTLFFDDFNRTVSTSLGGAWATASGAWRDDGKEANSNFNGLDRAVVPSVSCADCRIDARMVNFGGGESMLELRGNGNARYALALRANGTLDIRRYDASGAATLLASAASGIADLTNWSSFAFVVQGSAPVSLTGSVNGVVRVSASDASSAALVNPGVPGIAATYAGIWFDDFTVSGSSPPPPTGSTDWPMYRHDLAATSNAGTSLTTTQAKGLHVVFKVSVPYGSAANPVVSGGTVYVAAGGGSLMAIDAGTGAIKWTQPLGSSSPNSCVSSKQGPIGAAAVSGQLVFAPGGNGTVYAFDKDTGALRWSTAVADTTANQFLWSSAWAVNGKVYIGVATLGHESTCGTVPGRLVQMDAATGAVTGTFWSNPTHGGGGSIWTTPAHDAATGRLFITTGNPDLGQIATSYPYTQAFVAIDPATMQAIDSFQAVTTDALTDNDFGASPILYDSADGRHFIEAINKNGYAYALDRNNLAAGVVWKTQVAAPGDSPDLGSGSIAGAAFANGMLFVAGEATTDGFPGVVAALNPATGAFLWKMHPSGYVLPGLAAAGQVLFAGVTHSDDTGELDAIDQSSGAVLFRLSTPGQVYAQPTWANGRLYVVDAAGTLYALSP